MRAAERVIGFPLPPLLRRIYGEIANGGVGPFLGVEGLPGGYSSEYGEADDEREIGNTGYRRAGPTGAEFCCPVRASVGRVCRAMSSGVVPYQDCRSHIDHTSWRVGLRAGRWQRFADSVVGLLPRLFSVPAYGLPALHSEGERQPTTRRSPSKSASISKRPPRALIQAARVSRLAGVNRGALDGGDSLLTHVHALGDLSLRQPKALAHLGQSVGATSTSIARQERVRRGAHASSQRSTPTRTPTSTAAPERRSRRCPERPRASAPS